MGPAVRIGRDVELPLVAELVSAVSDEPAGAAVAPVHVV